MRFPSKRFLCLAAFLPWTTVVFADPTITVTPQKAGGVYKVGEKIVWDVKVTGNGDVPLTKAAYVLRKGGAAVIGEGTLEFKNGAATIETKLDQPGTILAEVTVPPLATNPPISIPPSPAIASSPATPGIKGIRALGGAAVAPEQLQPSAPPPDDFDAFWQAKIAELSAIPENAVLEKVDSGRPGVDYWKISMDNIRGTHIRGQIARPAGDKKVPAMLIVQWAGVYPLQKDWVTNRASEGWLVLNLNAHDLPIDQPKAFYDNLKAGALKDYTKIGQEDKDKSYFVRMFMSCYRGVEYLSERPDWDGKTLAVSGASQGGLQSFVAAGLDPKVTEMMVLVPAGCDDTGALAGRKPGWPFGVTKAGPEQMAQLKIYSYFDAVNFARRVKCPALIGLGLIDETSPPSGVYTAVDQLRGPKEIVVLVNSDHIGTGNAQAPYIARLNSWCKSLAATGKPDLKAATGE